MSEQKYTLSTRQFPLVDKKAKQTKLNFTGVTLRVGASDLTGDPIATIAVFNSLNRKTGNTIQVYNIPISESPIEAVKSGLDSAVCGDCALKPSNDNVCYVKKFHGPSAVYRTFKAGRYPLIQFLNKADKAKVLALLKSKPIRLGAWGDPLSDIATSIYLAAINPQVLGYTHQWENTEDHEWLQSFLMASVDTAEEYAKAKKLGWRTYRHTTDNLAFDNEIICPHATHETQCIDCGLCSGTNSGSDKDIVTKTL
mgnify:CR=1 FL=1